MLMLISIVSSLPLAKTNSMKRHFFSVRWAHVYRSYKWSDRLCWWMKALWWSWEFSFIFIKVMVKQNNIAHSFSAVASSIWFTNICDWPPYIRIFTITGNITRLKLCNFVFNAVLILRTPISGGYFSEKCPTRNSWGIHSPRVSYLSSDIYMLPAQPAKATNSYLYRSSPSCGLISA